MTGVSALVPGFRCGGGAVWALLLRSFLTQGKTASARLGQCGRKEENLQTAEPLNVTDSCVDSKTFPFSADWTPSVNVFMSLLYRHVRNISSHPPLTSFPPSSAARLPHSSFFFFFCKFSFLTLCQVKGMGHPGVNCTARNGWRKKSGKQFPHIS